jgi:steroid delta-isomerase
MANPEQIRKTIDAYVDALARADRDGWVGLFAPEAVQIDPIGTPPNVGRDAIRAFWDRALAMADTVVFDVHHLHVCGDEAAMVFTGTVHLGDGGMVFDGVDIMRFDDAGQISELRAYWDPAAMRALS